MKNNVISVIIGIGSYNDLGLIRSCGEAGMRSVYLICNTSLVIPIYKSRYVVDYKFISIDKGIILNELKRLRQQYSNVYVFPASDDAVLIMDTLQKDLPSNTYTSHANGKIANLMDKQLMDKLAKSVNLRSPETVVCHVENMGCPIDFPIILKPQRSIDGNKSDIRICADSETYIDSMTELKDKGYRSVLVQQYLHNDSSKEFGITGVAYSNGDVEIHGMIHKIRNRSNINNFGKYYPNVENVAIDKLKQFIQKTGYIGIFDTDFIEYNNELYFIECNFRNGAYGYCVTQAGFNMPSCFITQKPETRQLNNVVFMEERTDVLNVLDGSMPVLSWLKDVFHTNTFLWINMKDMKPMLRVPYFLKKSKIGFLFGK